MLNFQLSMGKLVENFSDMGYIAAVPLLIAWIVFLVFFFKKKYRRFFLWYTVVTIALYLAGFAMTHTFWGISYYIADRTGIYIPYTVQSLDQEIDWGIDGGESYFVARMSPSQTDNFMQAAQAKGTWKRGTMNPNTLFYQQFEPIQTDPRLSRMDSREYKFPDKQIDVMYHTENTKRSTPGGEYYTRVVYVLDIKANTLYIYYDDEQWS